jgi:hypothetical protein
MPEGGMHETTDDQERGRSIADRKSLRIYGGLPSPFWTQGSESDRRFESGEGYFIARFWKPENREHFRSEKVEAKHRRVPADLVTNVDLKPRKPSSDPVPRPPGV